MKTKMRFNLTFILSSLTITEHLVVTRKKLVSYIQTNRQTGVTYTKCLVPQASGIIKM